MSENPVIIKPGDEVVLVLNGTYFNFGKLTGLTLESMTPPPIRERAPLNEQERIRFLQGHRFFEQGLGFITTVVKFTFDKDTAYVPTLSADTGTPDSSAD